MKKLPERIALIPSVELFRAGEWTAGAMNCEDIAEIVSTYDPKSREAQICIDHNEKGPSLGQVSRVWQSGQSLFGDLVNVASSLAKGIMTGEWRGRSVGIRNWKDTGGKKYLQHLSFLGAHQPACPGLAPIKFEDCAIVTFADGAEGFNLPGADYGAQGFDSIFNFSDEMPKPPEGAVHGVIVKTESCGSNMQHSHEVFLDADGNGFTGPARRWDDYGISEEDGGHAHAVVGAVIQAAGDPAHTHEMTIYLSKTTGNEDITMSDKIALKDGESAVATAELNELRAKAGRTEAAETALQKFHDDARATARIAKFSAAFDKAASEGRITPAQREAELAVFEDLNDETVVKFSDGDRTKADNYLAALKARPAIVTMGDVAAAGTGASRTDPNAEDANGLRQHNAIVAFQDKNPGVSYQDAMIATAKTQAAA